MATAHVVVPRSRPQIPANRRSISDLAGARGGPARADRVAAGRGGAGAGGQAVGGLLALEHPVRLPETPVPAIEAVSAVAVTAVLGQLSRAGQFAGLLLEPAPGRVGRS